MQESTFLSKEILGIDAKVPKFLLKLWHILTDPGYEGIIQWNSCNGEFSVFDIKKLEKCVLPFYFKSAQYSSFQRQLNYFAFSKVGSCSYRHAYFDRTNPSKISQIKRKVNTGNTKKRMHQIHLDQELCPPAATKRQRRRTTREKHDCKDNSNNGGKLARPTLVLAHLKPEIQKEPYNRNECTPRTPFFECLAMADKLCDGILAIAESESWEVTATSICTDLAAFELNLDWAFGIS
jgi:hypothetical protein